MVGREISPTEIGKHVSLIKNAQEEMANMDVLVCGRCLNVFYLVDEFTQHKQKPCYKEGNSIRECNDTKPKIWAFLLWKSSQLNNNKDNNITSPNSWALYQKWVKMDENQRETWIVAGKTIQSFARVSHGSLQEMPVKITKTVVNSSQEVQGRKPVAQTKPQVTNIKPPPKVAASNKSSPDSETESTSPHKSPLGINAAQKIVKKPALPMPQLPTKPAVVTSTTVTPTKPKPLSRRAKRSVPNSEEVVEENVEKIVAKRFNPRRRMHEYLVKWENRSLEQNTWELASNLENVPQYLETFEKQLARQKESRAAMQAKQAALNQAGLLTANKTEVKPIGKDSPLQQTSPLDSQKIMLGSPSERPQRTSKTKAMDQVKQWVGTQNSGANSPNSEAAAHQNDNEKDWPVNTSTGSAHMGGLKRKLDDTDYNDSNADDLPPSTTNTFEDLEEELIPSHTLKRAEFGNAVSVEVKTKTDTQPKLLKVNGTATTRSESQSFSAEVTITQDSNSSGVVKKPGFSGSSANQKTEAQVRVLSKGESAISSSGIVRVGSSNDLNSLTPNKSSQLSTSLTESKPHIVSRTQQVRSVTSSAGRTTPTQNKTVGQQQLVRTPSGTTIQRKTVPATNTIQRGPVGILQTRSISQTSPSSGRMIIPRQSNPTANVAPRVNQQKAVTPEQKILQLSKSGDLKVTKKVMTREDVLAQRQQNQQQLQQRQRQQSQVHIQKVQQLSGPAQRNQPAVAQRKQVVQPQQVVHHQQQQQEEEEHQAQICPITGNILGQEETQQQLASGIMQTQLVAEHQQQQQHHLSLQQEQAQQQQQLQDMDSNLLLTQDQMLTNEDGSPLLVTGEDGTVYQVAGKNADGQTILITQGPDGEHQFAYVAAAEGENENQVLTLDNAVAEAVAQLPAEQQAEALAATAVEVGGGQYLVKTTQEDGTTQVVTMTEAEIHQHQAMAAQQQMAAQAANAPESTNQLCIQTSDGSDGQEANIPAEVVQAEPPSPGGTRRVVLLLQDGTFMMTEMQDEEFKALNLAA